MAGPDGVRDVQASTTEPQRAAAQPEATTKSLQGGEYRSFLGTAGEAYAASFIALRGYVVSLPLTDVGEDLFATDPATSDVIRVQVKTARRTLDKSETEASAEEADDDGGDTAVENNDEAVNAKAPPALDSGAPPKRAGRPKNNTEQALYRVTIKRSQLNADIDRFVFVFNLVNEREFRSFVVSQIKLREMLTKDGGLIFKKDTSLTKSITFSVDADKLKTGEVRIGGTGKKATSMTDFEGKWDPSFPATTICANAEG